MACIKCGVPLVKEDRGNIQLGNPDGFEHIDCSKTKYISKETAKKEFPILPTEPVKEKKVEAVPEYKPIKPKVPPNRLIKEDGTEREAESIEDKKPKWAHRFLAKEEKIEKGSEETSEESEE